MIYPAGQKSSLFIDTERCRNCRRCLAQKACTLKALIRIDRDEPPFVDVHRCHNCRICMQECPFEAIRAV